MSVEFTGNESLADVLQLALNNFSFPSKSGITARIVYKRKVPYLDVHVPGRVELSSQHRLDNLLLEIYPYCETVVDGFIKKSIVPPESRQELVTLAAYVAMDGLLYRLMVLQMNIYQDNLEDARFLTPAMLLHGIANSRPAKDPKALKQGMVLTVKAKSARYCRSGSRYTS